MYFYFKGLNVPFTQIQKDSNPITVSGKTWSKTIAYADIRESVGHYIDAGNYTFYVSLVNSSDESTVTSGGHATANVWLKQCMISITSIDNVVAQGDNIVVKGRADAAKSVIWYLVGTNYFSTGIQGVTNNEFTITIDKQHTSDEKMAAGQYFLIVQHPMCDDLYSVAPEKMDGMSIGDADMNSDNIRYILQSEIDGVYNSGTTLSKATGYDTAVKILKVDDGSQSANFAYVLCDALDSQNFDDMYAKSSFVVCSPNYILNPIPQKIIKGESFVISGAGYGHVGETVTAEITPVGAAESDTSISLTTTVGNDRRWSITFDTSSLNIGEYNLSFNGEDEGSFSIIDGKAGMERYELIDAETASGGPLILVEKETITPIVTNQLNEQSSLSEGSSVWFTDENGTQYKPGDYVKVTLKVLVEKNCLTPTDRIDLKTDLANPSWTINTLPDSSWTALTQHLTGNLVRLSAFDSSWYQSGTQLDITLIGYIPAGDIGSLLS